MEIERKFLLDQPPFALDGYTRLEIEQAYISVDPVIRLRRANEEYFLTVKLSGQIAREEAEWPLTKEQYANLSKKVETGTVSKTRYRIPIQDRLTAELDVYHGALTGLLTVEVEFATLEDALAFTPPSWFGRDVSEEQRYKNSNLAVNGFCGSEK